MTRTIAKLIHQGRRAAGVPTTFIDDDDGRSPCLCLEDALERDAAPDALRAGDLNRAASTDAELSFRPYRPDPD